MWKVGPTHPGFLLSGFGALRVETRDDVSHGVGLRGQDQGGNV